MKLDPQTKELVALATALAVKCQPCFALHCKLARELGVDEEMIRETVQFAKNIRATADKNMDGFTERMMESRDGGENHA